MNFKGTRNIPRDQVKGIIEQFGGTWNGYTWIDQTTYLETASRDALDRMLFIEAERMSSCLYEPEDCESERTVIISELKGGENDPEQLLDIELTAAAFRVHPYQHPTIGWLRDLETMTRDDLYGHYRRYYVPEQRDAGHRRRRRHRRGAQAGRASFRIDSAERAASAASRAARAATAGRAPRALPQRGHDRLLARGVSCAGVRPTPTSFRCCFVDAALTGASGLNLWSGHKVPTPQRSARLYRAIVDSGLASSVGGALLPTEHPFLYYLWATVAEGQTLQAVEDAVLRELDRFARDGITEPELTKVRAQLRARFVYDSDSVTDIAHQLGYFETIGDAGRPTTS